MNTKSILKRICSLVLAAVMVVSFMPKVALPTAAIQDGSRVTDPHTLDQWKNFFGQTVNNPQNVALTTEFAGGVWTDKSVFTPSQLPGQLTNATYNGANISVEDNGDNFVVALSAMASNKQIKGYSTIPTDTVLILDLSSSMRYTDDNGGSAVDELVEATNKAIKDLLELNRNNRVAVVIYAGNVDKTFDHAADGITKVVLPLDTYTANNDVYLVSKSVGRNPNHAIEVAPGVKAAGSTDSMDANRFEVATGTFMQDGIYEAMKLLLTADPVVREGVQTGTIRKPIMVLMTDGEPTMACADYNGNDSRTDLGVSEMNTYDGSTGQVSHRDTIAFVTSLTAAFAKKQVEAHYGSQALMYTLPYGTAVQSRPEALSVLNPVNSSAIQNQLWNDFLNGQRVTVFRKEVRNNVYEYIYTSNSSVDGEKLVAEDRLYVDKYFPARNDDAMLQAFEDIVAEIIIQSKYYPTYVEKDYDHDGYLTFADKIGSYMEVKSVEGIVIGNRLFSGAALASKFNAGDLGTIDSPTDLGNELVWSVQERLNIPNADMARALLENAYLHGQLSYTDADTFEHYIGWFSDASGNCVDFWHEGMTEEDVQKAVTNKNATHIIRSYGFLGDTTVVPGVSNTDMMYMTVRVATEIATGESIVTWRIPASLVPTVTYEVDVEVDSDNQIVGLTSLELEDGSATSPIRLVYQVGLRSDITDWNLTEKVSADYVSANGYTFYTNKWSASAEDTEQNTYSHFEPSVQNERYYYTQDTVVMTKSGDSYVPYTGSKPSGEGYYRSFQVFEKLSNGTLRIHDHYEPITAEAMQSVRSSGSQWVIPKDTVHRYYDYEVAPKVENTTGTMAHSDHPFVVKNGDVYYTYSTQGNNGKLTVAPATGIRLTKKLAEGFTSDAEFTFVITGNTANAKVVRLNEDGTEKSRTALANNGEVTLKAGESVYILGLAQGDYVVSEKIATGAQYCVRTVTVDGQTQDGTTAELSLNTYTISDVTFTNDKQGYGSLIVSKDVTYPEGFAPSQAHHDKMFTVDVTFSGNIASIVAPANATVNGNTYTLQLADGQAATFTNIAEGVTYTVTERDLTAGYTNTAVRYSNESKMVTANTADQAHVVNAYKPAPTNVDLEFTGTKTVTGGWPENASFTVRLWQIGGISNSTMVDTGLTATVTADGPNYRIDMSSLTFDAAGSYYFRLQEDVPENRIPDMAYDRSAGLLRVVVADTDADGQLEIQDVSVYQDTGLTGSLADGFTATKDFNNVVTRDIVYLDVTKIVADAADPSKTYTYGDGDITFGLFASMSDQTPAYYVLTDETGKATFAVPVSQDELGTEGKVYYLREIAPDVENREVGMDYDESWIYALKITWNTENNTASTQIAPITDGVVGTYSDYDRTNTQITHTNTLESNVQSIPKLVLSGEKTLNGQNDLGGRSFSFSLYRTTADYVIQGEALQTVTNEGNTITFEGISFDTAGMHYLSVKENATELGGVTVDEKHYHIAVLVEKFVDAEGVTGLRIAQGYPEIVTYGSADKVAADQLNFNNLYTVTGEASVTISGNKSLTGRSMLAGEFTFELVQTDENGNALENGLTLTAENDPAVNNVAQFSFPKITYTAEGVHYYKITEKAGLVGNGIEYSQASYMVKVTVTDNGQGGYQASWVEVNDKEITFENVYTPQGTYADVFSSKELSGKVLADGQFSFELVQTKEDFTTVMTDGVNKTATNDIHGVVTFGRLTYTAEGTYYYVVREQIPDTPAPGITYDTTQYQVTVRVVDNMMGNLETFVSYQMMITENETVTVIPASSIVFYNSYNITGEAVVTLDGVKVMTGDTTDPTGFSFTIHQEGETDAMETVTTGADGDIAFGQLTFTEEGTYVYYIREVLPVVDGETVTEKDGITYDDTEYCLEVQVYDNDLGGLAVKCKLNGEELETDTVRFVFTNNYTKPKPSTPPTGDTTNLVLPVMLVVASMIGIVFCVTAVRKKENI